MMPFQSFNDWFEENKDANLSKVEKEFDLSAIPTQRFKKGDLLYEVSDDYVVEDAHRTTVKVSRTHLNKKDNTIHVQTHESYLPAILVRLRESINLEIVRVFTTDKNHIKQLNSINKKLNEKEKFACEVIFH